MKNILNFLYFTILITIIFTSCSRGIVSPPHTYEFTPIILSVKQVKDTSGIKAIRVYSYNTTTYKVKDTLLYTMVHGTVRFYSAFGRWEIYTSTSNGVTTTEFNHIANTSISLLNIETLVTSKYLISCRRGWTNIIVNDEILVANILSCSEDSCVYNIRDKYTNTVTNPTKYITSIENLSQLRIPDLQRNNKYNEFPLIPCNK